MVTAIVVLSILLLLAVPILIENRDLLTTRLFRARRMAPDEVPMPFLILPLVPGDADSDVPIAPARIGTPTRAARWGSTAAHGVTFAEPDGLLAVDTDSDAAEPGDTDAIVTDATIVFRRSGDEAMQLLPGRLRVVSGDPARDEIRLFGLIGEPARVTIGREQGPAYRVVTLKSPTVSRRHARLEFGDGGWVIRNLSRTNPVVVNDLTLDDPQREHRLADGDRIELGEVVLQFVERP